MLSTTAYEVHYLDSVSVVDDRFTQSRPANDFLVEFDDDTARVEPRIGRSLERTRPNTRRPISNAARS